MRETGRMAEKAIVRTVRKRSGIDRITGKTLLKMDWMTTGMGAGMIMMVNFWLALLLVGRLLLLQDRYITVIQRSIRHYLVPYHR